MKRIPPLMLWLLALLSMIRAASGLEAASIARVDVLIWFDTEDYLLPASDDAAKRLAELLSQRDIRATFKVVGEKARVLERRGRADVIAALRKHDIGYHSDPRHAGQIPLGGRGTPRAGLSAWLGVRGWANDRLGSVSRRDAGRAGLSASPRARAGPSVHRRR